MSPPSTETASGAARYEAAPHDRTTRAFHWATVLLVLTLYGLGLIWDLLPRGTARHLMIVTHISLGMVLTAVLLGRIVWRASPASTPQIHSGVQGLAARVVHLLLYGLLVWQTVLGWNWRWAQGQPLSFFDLFVIPSPFSYPEGARHTMGVLHYWTAHAIVALAALHAAAALFHHFVLRDDVLRRMTAWRLARQKA